MRIRRGGRGETQRILGIDGDRKELAIYLRHFDALLLLIAPAGAILPVGDIARGLRGRQVLQRNALRRRDRIGAWNRISADRL
ncbi:MAG: hypothetical protein KDJ20_18320, partial [Hyphomicrobiales bacterium]|nr:hypothetical protein [Hyphomicrobiales bacterium]